MVRQELVIGLRAPTRIRGAWCVSTLLIRVAVQLARSRSRSLLLPAPRPARLSVCVCVCVCVCLSAFPAVLT